MTRSEEVHGTAQGHHGAARGGGPGCHDAFSAKVIEKCGFEAIQVSGYGVAGSVLGKPDVGLVQMKDVLDITWNIAQAVDIPVMADVDTGGGNAVNAAWITERLIAMGVAGMNIEDQVFPKRCGHMAGKEVIDADEMAGKVRACADVRDRLDPDFIINARTDAAGVLGLDEAIRRCNLYLEAGADLGFIDGIRTRADVERAVKEVEGPALRESHGRHQRHEDRTHPHPGTGGYGGWARLHPVASIMVAHKALMEFFTALKESPTGTLPGQTQWASSFEEYTDFVGLKEYKAWRTSTCPGSVWRPSTAMRRRSWE